MRYCASPCAHHGHHGAKPKDKDRTKKPIGVPDTFKHLDLTWKPMLKATDGGVPDKEASVTGGYFQSGKPGSGREKRTLQTVKTHFFVGTERSPFFMDILLVVGGWNFTIWKEAVVVSDPP
ncbi:hypothetical protein DPMN_192647 [Dreissena polymorpha]|uniref:Uncharacterized protein n=1 Tax=Dreissena polymorpha TaxID=45954 RepID=A0A9D4BH13_DREPO|nr:hypothetical protein DPMN_192647 [Dreissena polymorpha]